LRTAPRQPGRPRYLGRRRFLHEEARLLARLEEILLHTREPLGDGVANPHSKSDIAYIQKLKAKHGIDYDSHASYRFVEE
jgi:hypothetical protein